MEETAVQGYLKSYVEARTPESPDDGVLLRNGHQLERIIFPEDVEAEVFEWILSHLDAREWPLPLSTLVAKTVSQKLNATLKIKAHGDDCLEWGRLQADAQETLQGLCSLWLEQPHLAPPMLAPLRFPISTSAVRNGRRKMEDRHIMLPYFNYVVGLEDAPEHSYYAVFDGHAGSEAAAYATAHLHHNIARHPEFLNDPVLAIREGFAVTEQNFLNRSSKEGTKSGCTAVCCLIRETKSGKKLYVGWLGDSQAVLAREGRPIALVEPHKPDREDERQRIVKLGGAVIMMGTWRVNGALAVSRALGDAEHKPYISSDPDVIALDLDGTEDFLILGCDGLWDQLTPDDVTQHICRCVGYVPEDCHYIAHGLVQSACEYGSTDNITTIVVFLRDPKEFGTRSGTIAGNGQMGEEHSATSELPTPPIDDSTQGDGAAARDDDLRQVASDVVNDTIQHSFNRVNSSEQYAMENGVLQTAQGIVEQVHQLHSEQAMLSFQEEFHGTVHAKMQETNADGIENPAFGGNQSEGYDEQRGFLEQDVFNYTGEVVKEDMDQAFSTNPFGSPGVPDTADSKMMEPVAAEGTETLPSTQEFNHGSALFPDFETGVPSADSTHSFELPAERAAPELHKPDDEEMAFNGGSLRPHTQGAESAESAESSLPSTLHDTHEASSLVDFHRHSRHADDFAESSQAELEHDSMQSYLPAGLPASTEFQNPQPELQQQPTFSTPPKDQQQTFSTLSGDLDQLQDFSTLPEDLRGLPATSVDSLPHEPELTSVPEELDSIDLSSAPRSFHESAEHDFADSSLDPLSCPSVPNPFGVVPESSGHVSEDNTVEASGFQDELPSDELEMDITESLSPAVSSDSVVEKAEQHLDTQHESAVIFCELKEPVTAAASESDVGSDTAQLQLQDAANFVQPLEDQLQCRAPEFAQQETAPEFLEDKQQHLPESDQGISVCLGAAPTEEPVPGIHDEPMSGQGTKLPIGASSEELHGDFTGNFTQIAEGSAVSDETIEGQYCENLKENVLAASPFEIPLRNVVGATALPDVVVPESALLGSLDLESQQPTSELLEAKPEPLQPTQQSLQHEPEVTNVPEVVLQAAVQETLDLLQPPADSGSGGIRPSEEPAPPVVLGAIPESVPEADGVTEDSDSEKDGGWKFVKPAIGVAGAAVAAAAATVATAATVVETTTEPEAPPASTMTKADTTPLNKVESPTKSTTQKPTTPSSKPPAMKGTPSKQTTKPAEKIVANKTAAKPAPTKTATKKPASRPASATTMSASASPAAKKAMDAGAAMKASTLAARKPSSAASRPPTAQSRVPDKTLPSARPRPAASSTLPSRPKAPTSAPAKPSLATSSTGDNTKKPLSSTRTTTLKTVSKAASVPSKPSTTTTVRQITSATTTKTTATSRTTTLPTKKVAEATGTTKPPMRTAALAKLDKDSTNQQLSTRKSADGAAAAASRVASARMAASAASQRAAASKILKQSSTKMPAAKQSAAKQATTESAATAIKPKKAQQNGICEEKGALEQQENKKGDSTEVPVSNGSAEEDKEAEEPVHPDGDLIQEV